MKGISRLMAGVVLAAAALAVSAGGVILDNGQRSEADLQRDRTSKPAAIIAFSGVKTGMVIGDVLGGGGYYSELLSQAVGKAGKVYLHNNQAYMPYVGKELNARLAGGRLPNVIRHDREVTELAFADNSLDMIFFVMGYHDMYHESDNWRIDPPHFLSQLHKALKPGGRLLVIDHAAPLGSKTQHAQELHRIDENYVKAELAAQGFRFLKASELLRNPDDNRLISPFTPAIRRQTDRFVLLFAKE